MSDRTRQLLDEIEDAFRGVELGQGVGLHETEALDLDVNEEMLDAARAQDERSDWHKLLSDPELRKLGGVGGIFFFDPLGLRFHLPAYLWLAVTEFGSTDWWSCGPVMFSLTNFEGLEQGRIELESVQYGRALVSRLERLQILNAAQRTCIRNVLIHIRDNHDWDDEWLSRSIDGYWLTDGHFEVSRFDDPNYAVDFS